MARTILAEGTWCKECEFFEVPDFDQGECLACGHPEHRHIGAEVISKEGA